MSEVHEVAVVALAGVVTLDLGVPTQVLHAARGPDMIQRYRVRVCTPDGAPVRSSAEFAVLPDHDLSLLDTADTVIVPGIAYVDQRPPAPESVLEALRAAYRRGARI